MVLPKTTEEEEEKKALVAGARTSHLAHGVEGGCNKEEDEGEGGVVCMGGFPSAQGSVGSFLQKHPISTKAHCLCLVWNVVDFEVASSTMVDASNFST